VSDDIKDPKPLTPSHFLLCKTYGSKPENVNECYDISAQDLLLNHSMRQHCISKFWKVWSDQYLRQLPAVVSKQFHSRQVKVGDLVLVRDENRSRLFWPLGVITKVFLSDDHICRSALVKTKKGIFKRSVNCLHQLECSNAQGSNAQGSNVRNCSLGSSNAGIDNTLPINNMPESCVDPINSFSESSDILSLVGPPEDVPDDSEDNVNSDPSTPEDVPDDSEDIVNSDPSTPASAVPSQYTTRRGRKVKPVVRLDL